ncbi:hypothetical protein CERZMDRAFT_94969 [Cercospora zeae-maydis SCOH1-5]|uniref:Uncharacterized protein n=1 Tax=Cercospora zeae-maydis SCOH1-5 TaxID=717836 RepID=A0A6A6FM75_9PEZI|nr:hypothetical protein CERZMDRAFT_94969 [Cercospora zeae-maydis SCOH1-5]
MPSTISPTIPSIAKNQVLQSLVSAAFTLHSGGNAVLDFAKALFGNVAVSTAVEEREHDEKMVGMNGGFGEGFACTSLARAYTLLIEHGEDGNAQDLKNIALERFLAEHFQQQVDWVGMGG